MLNASGPNRQTFAYARTDGTDRKLIYRNVITRVCYTYVFIAVYHKCIRKRSKSTRLQIKRDHRPYMYEPNRCAPDPVRLSCGGNYVCTIIAITNNIPGTRTPPPPPPLPPTIERHCMKNRPY